MSSPKLLPPTMRPAKRYIAFEIISENPVQYSELVNTIWTSTMNFLGEFGSSELNMWFVHNLYDEKTQKGLIKCSHDSVEHVRVALSLIQIISESRVIVKIMGVTGTIKSARTKYLSIKDLTSFVKEE
ncbi:ribonuclease P protein component 2 [archaeon]|nr:ribonuclease P protein component 2 [archaeon]